MKTLKMSRKIEAAVGACLDLTGMAQPLEVVHGVPGEDDEAEDGVDDVAAEIDEQHHEPERSAEQSEGRSRPIMLDPAWSRTVAPNAPMNSAVARRTAATRKD